LINIPDMLNMWKVFTGNGTINTLITLIQRYGCWLRIEEQVQIYQTIILQRQMLLQLILSKISYIKD
jgi:hypothetical protein